MMPIVFKTKLDLLHSVYKSRHRVSDETAERELNYMLENRFSGDLDKLIEKIENVSDRKYAHERSA